MWLYRRFEWKLRPFQANWPPRRCRHSGLPVGNRVWRESYWFCNRARTIPFRRQYCTWRYIFQKRKKSRNRKILSMIWIVMVCVYNMVNNSPGQDSVVLLVASLDPIIDAGRMRFDGTTETDVGANQCADHVHRRRHQRSDWIQSQEATEQKEQGKRNCQSINSTPQQERQVSRREVQPLDWLSGLIIRVTAMIVSLPMEWGWGWSSYCCDKTVIKMMRHVPFTCCLYLSMIAGQHFFSTLQTRERSSCWSRYVSIFLYK